MKDGKNKLPIIIIFAVGIALIICAIFFLITDGNKKEKNNQNENNQISDNNDNYDDNDINNKKPEDITINLDFNKMEQDLILLTNNYVPKIGICQEDGDEQTGPHTEYSFDDMSNTFHYFSGIKRDFRYRKHLRILR